MDKNKVISFDIGGTLIRPLSGDWYLTVPLKKYLIDCGFSPEVMGETMQQAKRLCAIPVLISSIQEEISANLSVYRSFFSLLPESAQANEEELLYFSHYRTRSELLYEFDTDVSPILESISRNNELALFSNTVPSVIHYLKSIGFLDMFQYKLFSCERGLKKPSAEFFDLFLSVVGKPSSNIVLYDDSVRVLQIANQFGIEGRLVQFEMLGSILRKDFS